MSDVRAKEPSSKELERLQSENTALNEREFVERKEILRSMPQRVFLQVDGPCNADCRFCSRGTQTRPFDLDAYLRDLAPALDPAIERSRELLLTGSGELLALPQAGRILDHFNARFPHVEKYLATNASHRDARLWEKVCDPASRYTLQISLHAASSAMHRIMTRTEEHGRVLENLRALAQSRRKTGWPRLNLMFVMTTLNAEELPAFVRLAHELGADRVIACYLFVYEAAQKYLSLYYRQDLANRVIDEARRAALELDVELRLPSKFGEAHGARPASERCQGAAKTCPEPWQQIMVRQDGGVLPCDAYGDFSQNIRMGFEEVWNGQAYRALRRSAAAGEGCMKTCGRRSPSSVDDWSSHAMGRHKDDAEMIREYRRAMERP
ncbi:MAG: radical SAM/SPASM domain-containing protein [Elusimicrobiota bacterium]|jgi:MoaA/NifB/PqqE/SkfB family radical SAM enzyme